MESCYPIVVGLEDLNKILQVFGLDYEVSGDSYLHTFSLRIFNKEWFLYHFLLELSFLFRILFPGCLTLYTVRLNYILFIRPQYVF